MKKISMVSLVALLAATPMMAEAARVEKVGASAPSAEEIAAKNIATTSYVKGAYKAAADKIDAVIDDTRVAEKAQGTYTAINVNSSVGENLAALDSAIANASSDAATDVTNKINALNSTVSQTTGDINVSVTEVAGKLSSVSASINSGAVTADKIDTGAVTFTKMNADAVVTNEEGGIASSVNSASDTALVTERAVAAALATVNGDVVGKQDQLTAGDSNIATTVVQAANVGEVSASGVNSASDTSLVTQKAALSAALAAETAAEAYVDAKSLTVTTTWGTEATSAIQFSALNPVP